MHLVGCFRKTIAQKIECKNISHKNDQNLSSFYLHDFHPIQYVYEKKLSNMI